VYDPQPGVRHIAPTSPHAGRQKYFPLDVLVIGLEDNDSRSLSDGLFARLSSRPPVRACAMTCDETEAASWIRDRRVNTVFVNPMSPAWNVVGFIERIRIGFPGIIVVLWAAPAELEIFFGCYPGFGRYARLPLYQRGVSGTLDADELDAALNRCDQWHVARHEYDICLSFAPEDRAVAVAIGARLRDGGTRVFYDDGDVADCHGKSRYCAILVSKIYAARRWTSVECIAARTLALTEWGHQNILPVRMDDTQLNGLPNTRDDLTLASGIEHLSDVLDKKLWMRGPEARRCIGTA